MPKKIGHGARQYRQGCKCETCRTANAVQYRKERLARQLRLAADPTLAPHGNKNTFNNWGCRCDECCDFMHRPRNTPPPPGPDDPIMFRGQERTIEDGLRRNLLGQDPRRARLLYEPFRTQHFKALQPFGREWLNEAV